jgi:drug/metabolite transporter (DMT)-like permease
MASIGQLKRPTSAMVGFLATWAALHGAATIVMFEAAGRVSGIMLSIVLALEGFMVFLLAALMRTESPSLRRFAGLAVGLGGVLVLLIARNRIEGVSDWLWILIALTIPTLYAFMDILADRRQPAGANAVIVVGLVMIISAAMTAPLALVNGQLFSPFVLTGEAALLILIEGIRTAAVYVFYILLIGAAGAVFGSQNAYVSTLAGIGWTILLLSEKLTLITFAALILVLAGLLLVGPKREAEDAEVRFVRRKHPV